MPSPRTTLAVLLLVAFVRPVHAGGGWLGVYLAASADTAVIVEVIPGSPAAQAGLQVGDAILAVDAADLRGSAAFAEAIGRRGVGDRLRLRVRRAGAELELAATLGAHPGANPVPPAPLPAGDEPKRPASPPRRE
ncbi:MAG: PDZ domain-containing protein [Planctomycetes bacterium]|nr:PDZ domain-containing protein [Planctomycetota bacterium]